MRFGVTCVPHLPLAPPPEFAHRLPLPQHKDIPVREGGPQACSHRGVRQVPVRELLQSGRRRGLVEATAKHPPAAYMTRGVFPGVRFTCDVSTHDICFSPSTLQRRHTNSQQPQASALREEHRRDGFEVGNADSIFASTTLAAAK